MKVRTIVSSTAVASVQEAALLSTYLVKTPQGTTAEMSTRALPATTTHSRYKASIALRNKIDMEPPRKPQKSRHRRRRVSPSQATAALLDRLDAFDHAGVFRTVFVPDRLDGILKRLLVVGVDLDDLDAGRPRLVKRILHILLPQHALLELRLAPELGEQRPVLLRHLVPGLAREHRHLRNDQMLIERVKLGHLVMVVENEAGRIVLSAVHHARLQRAEYLVVAHRHAVAAERIHHVDEHRVAHDAELHALEVGELFDRLPRVIEAARSRIHEAQGDEAASRAVVDLVEQFLADRPVDHLLHMCRIAEQIRQVEDVELIDDRAEGADADARDLDRADLRLLDRLLLASKLHRRIHLQADVCVEAAWRREGGDRA